MTGRFWPAIAFLTLVAFLGILLWRVPRLDLGAVIALTVALVAYDFFGPGSRDRT